MYIDQVSFLEADLEGDEYQSDGAADQQPWSGGDQHDTRERQEHAGEDGVPGEGEEPAGHEPRWSVIDPDAPGGSHLRLRDEGDDESAAKEKPADGVPLRGQRQDPEAPRLEPGTEHAPGCQRGQEQPQEGADGPLGPLGLPVKHDREDPRPPPDAPGGPDERDPEVAEHRDRKQLHL
jgi:hypothetical protein